MKDTLIPLEAIKDDELFWRGTRFRQYGVDPNVENKEEGFYEYMLAEIPGERDFMLLTCVEGYKSGCALALVKMLDPSLLEQRTDNNVQFINSKFEQYIHFEDLIIALSAILVEAELHGLVDLTKAYGNKTIKFEVEKEEIKPIYKALQAIYNAPEKYVMFEMCMSEEREETLNDIKNIATHFAKIVS